MNYKSMGHFIALICLIEAAFMAPCLILGLCLGEGSAASGFALTILLALATGGVLLWLTRGARKEFHEKEGLACTGLSWLILSLIGALPFFLSGQIPDYIDALFETASGLSTTGASVLSDVEVLSKSLLLWRSLTHWIGGMGVIVFLLALSPGGSTGGFTMHLMRAESPGPSVGKLVPRISDSSRILYCIYIGLTLLNFLFLLIGNMPVFDALCIAVGTAGTGGFSVTNAGLGGYSTYIQVVTTVFMLIFGINFSCYYLILQGKLKDVLKDEELRVFCCIILLCVAGILAVILPQYDNPLEAVKDAFFQAASLSSTTGFANTDYESWPSFAKAILLFLTVMGACAGSTCGGMKTGRLMLLWKDLKRNVTRMIRPNRVLLVRNNGQPVGEDVLYNIGTYLSAYVIILFGSFVVLTLDGFDLISTFAAALTCFNNVGPGLGMVGPTGNFGAFSHLSKLVLVFDMIAGRLEIFPVLALLNRNTWRHA